MKRLPFLLGVGPRLGTRDLLHLELHLGLRLERHGIDDVPELVIPASLLRTRRPALRDGSPDGRRRT